MQHNIVITDKLNELFKKIKSVRQFFKKKFYDHENSKYFRKKNPT